MPDNATMAGLRALLERERDDLRRQLSDLGFGDGGGLEYDSNFADSSQVTAERGEAEAVATTLREALTDVEAALGRFDEGTYGACERCGNTIAPDRLDAFPAARLCIDCMSK